MLLATASDAVALLRDCFGYRKSYCGHYSTDYDLAHSLAHHLSRRNDTTLRAPDALRQTRLALNLIHGVEEMPSDLLRKGKAMSARLWLFRQLRDARALALQQQEALALPGLPHFNIFNDNRYEQHWYSWSVASVPEAVEENA